MLLAPVAFAGLYDALPPVDHGSVWTACSSIETLRGPEMFAPRTLVAMLSRPGWSAGRPVATWMDMDGLHLAAFVEGRDPVATIAPGARPAAPGTWTHGDFRLTLNGDRLEILDPTARDRIPDDTPFRSELASETGCAWSIYDRSGDESFVYGTVWQAPGGRAHVRMRTRPAPVLLVPRFPRVRGTFPMDLAIGALSEVPPMIEGNMPNLRSTSFGGGAPCAPCVVLSVGGAEIIGVPSALPAGPNPEVRVMRERMAEWAGDGGQSFSAAFGEVQVDGWTFWGMAKVVSGLSVDPAGGPFPASPAALYGWEAARGKQPAAVGQFDLAGGEWAWSTPAGGGYRAPYAALTDKAYAALTTVAAP